MEDGYPLPVAFSKAKSTKRVKSNYDDLYEISRKLVLSYFSLNGKTRRKKVKEFLSMDGVNVGLPAWMERELNTLIDIEKYKKSLVNGKAQWFRVNRILADEDKILKSLEMKGLEFARDPDFPYIYRSLSKDVSKTEEFQNFKIIIQDKASVAVVEALKPKEYEKIYEMASSPGLKSQLIYEKTEGKVELFLAEIDRRRLDKEVDLLKKFGVDFKNVHFVNQDSRYGSIRYADAVLIDAPCSTSGVISIDPSILLSLRNKSKVKQYSRVQQSLLEDLFSIKFKRAVYSVCSIFPEEAEMLLDKLKDMLLPTDIPGSKGYTSFESGRLGVRYFNFVHKTEDFFIGKLKGNE
ncbi:RsmB/NOP family class I SAM-dependent RNA methyltransferase [Metallosphaera tengchongensis]|uniref:RsmB/NOP family class I SAM-dependent RNA methyltransferase n=1 Tax=Metallosphaera tengchongensis TaxID=1532350 RepID=UPI001FE6DE86|nr:RsmB/NOP family class I SAM-dependent RNA methyltransferase [Metallosphaera tengchongensis]